MSLTMNNRTFLPKETASKSTPITTKTMNGFNAPPIEPAVQKPTRRVDWRQLWSIFLLLVVIIVLFGVLKNAQAISDWWQLRGYHPPTLVVQFANEDSMSSYTRHLFYLNRPQIVNNVTAFRNYCPENKNTIVLGCYHAGQNGIYIYNVPDPTLNGVQQVTAAHEVLHAVYARLSSKEKSSVDSLLENYYKHDLHDPRVLAEVKLYQETEPNDVMDEMNSTFGTEIATLPAPLESYYRQFFTNRSLIVAYEQQYQGELTSRYNTINADDAKLATMQKSINEQDDQLTAQLARLTTERSQLDALLQNGQTSSYNDGVSTYNGLVDSYNQAVNSLQSNVNSYNLLVQKRNQVAGQLTTLDKALDTRVANAKAQ